MLWRDQLTDEADPVVQAEHGQTEEREPLEEFCKCGKSKRAVVAEEILCKLQGRVGEHSESHHPYHPGPSPLTLCYKINIYVICKINLKSK